MANKFDYNTPYPSSTSGVRGVSYVPDRKKWDAKISYQGKRIRLGHFDTLDEAKAAYEKAAERIRSHIDQDRSTILESRIQSLFD